MTEKLQQTIKEELAKLPKEKQAIINAVDWVKITEEIGKKYLLSENNTENFQVETMLILFGIQAPSLYALNIERNAGVTKEKSEQMSVEVLQKIFKPMNDIFVSNIKKSDKVKNAKPEQNLDFILSGGDYSAFLDSNSPLEEYSAPKAEGGGNAYTSSSLKASQSLNGPAKSTPQEGNKSLRPDPYREVPEETRLPITPTLADIQANMRRRNGSSV